jgi:hypothetical protein
MGLWSSNSSPKHLAKIEKAAEKVKNWTIYKVDPKGNDTNERFRGTQSEMFAKCQEYRDTGYRQVLGK